MHDAFAETFDDVDVSDWNCPVDERISDAIFVKTVDKKTSHAVLYTDNQTTSIVLLTTHHRLKL